MKKHTQKIAASPIRHEPVDTPGRHIFIRLARNMPVRADRPGHLQPAGLASLTLEEFSGCWWLPPIRMMRPSPRRPDPGRPGQRRAGCAWSSSPTAMAALRPAAVRPGGAC